MGIVVGRNKAVGVGEVEHLALVRAVERDRALVDDGAVLDRRCWLCGLLGGGSGNEWLLSARVDTLDVAIGLYSTGAMYETRPGADGATVFAAYSGGVAGGF